MATHFIVQLEHIPGSLARLARALAEQGVEIGQVSAGGIEQQGWTILATDDLEETRAVLRTGGWPYVEGESIVVEVEDRPGGLATVAERLAGAGVDIRSVLFLGRAEGIVETAICVDDVVRARLALGLD